MGQLLETRKVLGQRVGLRLVPVGLADISGALIDADGLSEETSHSALRVTADGCLLDALPEIQPLGEVGGMLQAGAILADLTASTGTEPMLRMSLDVGCGLSELIKFRCASRG